jgi:hypothetical protein
LPLVKWHLAIYRRGYHGDTFALVREGFSASLINNTAWVLFVIVTFIPIITAALPQKEKAGGGPAAPDPYTPALRL